MRLLNRKKQDKYILHPIKENTMKKGKQQTRKIKKRRSEGQSKG
jgi:hypothetical protein